MNAAAGLDFAGLDLADIPDRIQTEVQRAIQRGTVTTDDPCVALRDAIRRLA